MSILAIMIPIAMGLATLFLAFFFWAVHKDQFEDLVTPAHQMLLDDEEIKQSKKQIKTKTTGVT